MSKRINPFEGVGGSYRNAAPSCGCVFCDLNLSLFCDDNGFYHDGPEDTRIRCDISNKVQNHD